MKFYVRKTRNYKKISPIDLKIEEKSELGTFISQAYKIVVNILTEETEIPKTGDSFERFENRKIISNLLSAKDIEYISKRYYEEELKEKSALDLDSYCELHLLLMLAMIRNFSIFKIQRSTDIQEEIGIYQKHILTNSHSISEAMDKKIDNKDYFWLFYMSVQAIGFKNFSKFESVLKEGLELSNIDITDASNFRKQANQLSRVAVVTMLIDAVKEL